MLCIPFRGNAPLLKPGSRVAPNATLTGSVILEKGASVWFGAVIRGDLCQIHVGENSNLQDNVVVHTRQELPVSIGKQVSVGHSAILHGCTIGNNCLIGMGSILMDECVIGDKCLIGAGSLVTQGTIIPPGSLVMGSPAKVKRPLTQQELEMLDTNYLEYVELSREHLPETP